MTKPFLLLIGIYYASIISVFAQDDLLDLLAAEEPETTEYTYGTFKGTKIIHSSSVDIQPKGDLQFSINHRFGNINSGHRQLWGLDDANIRLGFEYGLTDKWAIGVGRSSQQATFDFYSKYKLLRQSSGLKEFPFTLVWNANAAIGRLANAESNDTFNNRLFYTHQLLIARKFGDRLSIQLSPTFTHNNVRERPEESNDTFYFGFAGRFKITNRMAIVADYYYIFDEDLKEIFDEPLGVALEIETGGHVFQIILSNSRGMTEKLFLARTDGQWNDGDIRLGFNISRTFPLSR